MSNILKILFYTTILFQLGGCLTNKKQANDIGDVDIPTNWNSIDKNNSFGNKSVTFWLDSFNDIQLNKSVYIAWSTNPNLLSQAEQTLARGEEAVISGAELFPMVNLGINGSQSKRNLIGFNLPNGDTSFTSDSFNSGINLSWEIDLWGKIRAQRKSSEKRFELAKAEYQGVRLSLAGQVAMAWFSKIESENQLELAKQTTLTFQKNQRFLANRFANGLVTSLENDLATNALASAQANQLMRERTLNASIRKFELLLGQKTDFETDHNFSNNLPDLSSIPIPPTPAETLQARPDLQIARFQLESYGHDLTASKRTLLPSISISGTSGSRTNEFKDLLDSRFRTWEIAGSITQPIFNGGRLRANIRRSEALRKAAIANYRAVALRAFSEVETILANESFLQNEESYLAIASKAAQAAAQASWNRYRNGVLGIFDTLESQRRAFEAESRLLSIKKQRISNRVQLFLALGTPALPIKK